MDNIKYSIVVPAYNEEQSLPLFFEKVIPMFETLGESFEIIVINDGSRDKTEEILKDYCAKDKRIRGVSFSRNFGQQAGFLCGLKTSRGEAVSAMDADLQDSPDEIPELYRMITKEGYDLVSGWKKKRYDPLSKTIPTKLFNATARKVSGIKNLHDFNCGLKAYKKAVVKHIEVYGDMHRYIPYLAKNAGYGKIGEKVVQHQARKYGVTKFGLDRFVNGYLDLATLWFQTKFGIKPMHIFGLLGSLMFLLGFLAVMVVLVLKTVSIFSDSYNFYVTNSVYFYLALTAIVVGTQFFLTGFVGELITRNSAERNNYQIGEEF